MRQHGCWPAAHDLAELTRNNPKERSHYGKSLTRRLHCRRRWRIDRVPVHCEARGKSPWLVIMIFIPIVNLAFVPYLAFSE